MPFYLNTLSEIFSDENFKSIDVTWSLKENELNKAAKQVHTDCYTKIYSKKAQTIKKKIMLIQICEFGMNIMLLKLW